MTLRCVVNRPVLGMSVLLAVSLALTCFVAPSSAQSLVSVSELRDAPATHWDYEALRDLVEKYNVLEGYPDYTFRGERVLTRWEMAAALNQVALEMGKAMARLGAEKANRTDLQTLARLQEEFRVELNALASRTTVLENRSLASEAKNDEQDARLTGLEKTTLHGDFTIGGLSNMGGGGTSGRKIGGIKDSIESIGRLRISMDVPVRPDGGDDSKMGAGTLSTRMIVGFGEYANNQTNPTARGADYSFNMYSRIAADASPSSDGLFVGGANPLLGTGINLRSNVYLESAFYKQHLKAGIPLLTDLSMGMAPASDPHWQATGDVYSGLVRWWDLFDLSPYRGNELTQFQNNAFINIPGLALNIVQPMVAYQLHQGLGEHATLDLTAALGSYTIGNRSDGSNLTYEVKLNYTPVFLGERFAKPGSVYAGAYHIFNAGNTDTIRTIVAALTNRSGGVDTNVAQQTNAHSFYVGWNQEWFRGIGTNVGYLLNNSSGSTVALITVEPGPGAVLAGERQALSVVVSVPMSAFGLEGLHGKDGFGLGYAFSDLHEGGLTGQDFSDGLEHVMEAYYRHQVTETLSLVPSCQLILNRLGLRANNPHTVLGLRMNATF